MSEDEHGRRKLEKVDAVPLESNPYLGDVEQWGQEKWLRWLEDAYRNLDIPYAESFHVKNVQTRENMVVILEQLHEGVAIADDIVSNMFKIKGKIKGKRPTIYTATQASMEEMKHGGKAHISYVDGDIFLNLDSVAKDAGQYWEGDNEAFHYFGGKNAKGKDVAKTYAGFAGQYLLQGIEMAANHYFQQLYGNLEGVKPFSEFQTRADFDSQPPVMFGLLLQVKAATTYLDMYYDKVVKRHKRRGREIKYPHINDKTVELFLTRIREGWHNLPKSYEEEFAILREEVEKTYQHSYTIRHSSVTQEQEE